MLLSFYFPLSFYHEKCVIVLLSCYCLLTFFHGKPPKPNTDMSRLNLTARGYYTVPTRAERHPSAFGSGESDVPTVASVLSCRLSELPSSGRKRGINAVQRTERTGHEIELHGFANTFEEVSLDAAAQDCSMLRGSVLADLKLFCGKKVCLGWEGSAINRRRALKTASVFHSLGFRV